jgi:pyruvate formate lyase activating enzyme
MSKPSRKQRREGQVSQPTRLAVAQPAPAPSQPKERSSRPDARPPKPADPVNRHLPSPRAPIAVWPPLRETDDGFQTARPPRDGAVFWHATPHKGATCDLCYRRCELRSGDAGWCGIRRNDGGRLALTSHGVAGVVMPRRIQGHLHYKAGLPMTWVAGLACTARCVFCSSSHLAWAPDRLPWLNDVPNHVGNGVWAYLRGVIHPQGILAKADELGSQGIHFGGNEPTLTYELTYDTARLAKAAGLDVVLDTNGFTTVEAVRALAPFVDSVYIGFKGHLIEDFYTKRVRAAGAPPHVLAATQAWHEAGVAVMISDIVPPPHFMDADTAREAVKRLTAWICETLGQDTVYELRTMARVDPSHQDHTLQEFLPRDADETMRAEFWHRLEDAAAIAEEQGLRYVMTTNNGPLSCHNCDALLVGPTSTPDFEVHVTDGQCDACGEDVPIVAVSKAEARRAADAWGDADMTIGAVA